MQGRQEPARRDPRAGQPPDAVADPVGGQGRNGDRRQGQPADQRAQRARHIGGGGPRTPDGSTVPSAPRATALKPVGVQMVSEPAASAGAGIQAQARTWNTSASSPAIRPVRRHNPVHGPRRGIGARIPSFFVAGIPNPQISDCASEIDHTDGGAPPPPPTDPPRVWPRQGCDIVSSLDKAGRRSHRVVIALAWFPVRWMMIVVVAAPPTRRRDRPVSPFLRIAHGCRRVGLMAGVFAFLCQALAWGVAMPATSLAATGSPLSSLQARVPPRVG